MKRYVRSTDDILTHPAIAKSRLTTEMLRKLGDYHRLYKAGDNVFDMLHAYLDGLQDAGVITDKEHGDIFCEVMEID